MLFSHYRSFCMLQSSSLAVCPDELPFHFSMKYKQICTSAQRQRMSPLSLACCSSCEPKFIRYVLSKEPTHLNVQDEKTLITPLHWTCINDAQNDLDNFALLIKLPTIDINKQDEEGLTPLHRACIHVGNVNDTRIDQLLATGKIDFSLKSKNGEDFIQFFSNCYTQWWKTCEDAANWSSQEKEKLIMIREWSFHKIVAATAQPIPCALIKFYFSCTPLLPELQALIMHLLYQLNIELIVARKCKITPTTHLKAEIEGYYNHYAFCCYYMHTHEKRQQIKKDLMERPTREDVQLLW